MFNGHQPSATIAFLWNTKLVIEGTRQLHADPSMFTASLTKDERFERKRSKKYGGYLLEITVTAPQLSGVQKMSRQITRPEFVQFISQITIISSAYDSYYNSPSRC